MGSFSLSHWIVVALVVVVLFGRGRVAETMGDFGKGIRSFRRGLSEGDVEDSSSEPENGREPS
jgi:sec-independent protein translocase protein TatA